MRTAVGVAVAALLLVGAAGAPAHKGDPNMRSQVRAIDPAVPGLTVSVLNFDDRLELRNRSGREVVVEGYDGEPYARLRADGTVEVNRNSEAAYLNDDRYAQVEIPDDLPARVRWEVVGETGRFEWHDHRIHWMSSSDPPQVTDPGARTRIFDWEVPLEVGGEPAAITGRLDWVPLPGGGIPAAVLWPTVAVVAAGLGGVAVVRRRRAAGAAPADGGEAW